VRLGRTFDAVMAADAMDYMLTEDDLRAAFRTAFEHLRPGGVYVTYAEFTPERFRQDRTKVTLSGKTIKGERATRDIWVCGAGAYIVLKALAFKLRGENKDAYDLFYVLGNYGENASAIVQQLEPLRTDPATIQAIDVLRRDFTSHDGLGPMRVAKFLTGGPDDTTQADVVGFIDAFLRRYEGA